MILETRALVHRDRRTKVASDSGDLFKLYLASIRSYRPFYMQNVRNRDFGPFPGGVAPKRLLQHSLKKNTSTL